MAFTFPVGTFAQDYPSLEAALDTVHGLTYSWTGFESPRRSEKIDRIRREFTTLTLVLIPVAIALNAAIGQLVFALKVPLYVDSIGTVLVGVLVGSWAGALTGFLSNLVWTFTGPFLEAIDWAGVAAIIGALAGEGARRMIAEALKAEADEYIEKLSHLRDERGYALAAESAPLPWAQVR